MRDAIALKPSSTIAGLPSAPMYLAPYEIAGPASRWPERSQPRPIATFWLCCTFCAAATQSSQVALSPGSATLAWSNSVLLMNGPVTVSWVMKPGMAFEPSGRIQSR